MHGGVDVLWAHSMTFLGLKVSPFFLLLIVSSHRITSLS